MSRLTRSGHGWSPLFLAEQHLEVLSTPLIGPDPHAFAELEQEGVTEAIVVPWMHYPGDGSLESKVHDLRQLHTEVITPVNG